MLWSHNCHHLTNNRVVHCFVTKLQYSWDRSLHCCLTYLPSDLLSVSAVMKELSVVQKKWRTIGEELGVKKGLLDHIRTNYSGPGNRLREVLSNTVSHHTTTWGDIVAALRTPRVGQSQLADHLEAKYCPSELAIHQKVVCQHIVCVNGLYC